MARRKTEKKKKKPKKPTKVSTILSVVSRYVKTGRFPRWAVRAKLVPVAGKAKLALDIALAPARAAYRLWRKVSPTRLVYKVVFPTGYLANTLLSIVVYCLILLSMYGAEYFFYNIGNFTFFMHRSFVNLVVPRNVTEVPRNVTETVPSTPLDWVQMGARTVWKYMSAPAYIMIYLDTICLVFSVFLFIINIFYATAASAWKTPNYARLGLATTFLVYFGKSLGAYLVISYISLILGFIGGFMLIVGLGASILLIPIVLFILWLNSIKKQHWWIGWLINYDLAYAIAVFLAAVIISLIIWGLVNFLSAVQNFYALRGSRAYIIFVFTLIALAARFAPELVTYGLMIFIILAGIIAAIGRDYRYLCLAAPLLVILAPIPSLDLMPYVDSIWEGIKTSVSLCGGADTPAVNYFISMVKAVVSFLTGVEK